ncbi:TRAP transporter small permease [Citricoccus muralis]|uniref:TRAP transporter small permease n=1 Tax=Citricoccus muralis TaxID=169134 RepID=A0ABY8H6F4_9MICC|nr:TRAP transporter small permease [Citricoccus muralis]WFP16227.1 TRAP transporter small permease [Citricoccus muralis]
MFISAPLAALASISTLIIMVAVTIDVVSRNFLGRSVPGLLEMSETALVATVFLGLAYAGATNAHVAVDLLTDRFPQAFARRFAGVVWLLASGMVLWYVLATLDRALQSTSSREISQGLMQWPLWPSRWLVVIGFATFLLIALINAALSFMNEPLLGEDEDTTLETKDIPS